MIVVAMLLVGAVILAFVMLPVLLVYRFGQWLGLWR